MTASVCQIVDFPKTNRTQIIWHVISTDARIMKDASMPQTVDTAPITRKGRGSIESPEGTRSEVMMWFPFYGPRTV
jgi:hypothetical protein